MPHLDPCFIIPFWDFIVTPKKLKLDLNIITAKWILWFKTIPGETLQTTEWTTNSWKFWCLCKRFPNFYIKWIQIYRKTRYRRVIYRYPNTINIFQLQIYFLNSKMFSKKYFCDSWCKKEMEDKILNSFFGSAKFIYSLSLHISSFPWRLSCHHDDHTRSKFSSLHYQITCKL